MSFLSALQRLQRLAAFGAPGPSAPPRSVAPASADQTASEGPRPLHLRGGRQGVLLLHGLSSSPQELQFLARGLHRAGYTVRVPVIEGYSYVAEAPFSPWGRWADAALAEFDALRAECDDVAVGGLCIGAVLALRVAALRAPLVGSVLALSTTLHYDGWATPWSRRLLPLSSWVPWTGRIAVREQAPWGVKDPRMSAWIGAQMQSQGQSEAGAAQLTVRDLVEAQRLIADVRRRLPDITAPTLLLHAREDDAASPRSAYEVASKVRSASVRCVLLGDCYHMISIDREKHRVLAEMREFLRVEWAAAAPSAGQGTDNLLPFVRHSTRSAS